MCPLPFPLPLYSDEFSEFGLTAGSGFFVDDVAFGCFIELFVDVLEKISALGVFGGRSGQKLLDRLFKFGPDVQIVHVSGLVFS